MAEEDKGEAMEEINADIPADTEEPGETMNLLEPIGEPGEEPGEEQGPESVPETAEEPATKKPVSKSRKQPSQSGKKKGNWKTIGHEPLHYELYPCLHRWQKAHPKGPCIQYKQIRWLVLPLSERMLQLSMPLLRRLLTLWLEFGDKFPPEMRNRLMKGLTDNYGLTQEFLEQIGEEAKKVKEEALEAESRKKGKGKESKGKKKKGKGKKKGKRGGKGKRNGGKKKGGKSGKGGKGGKGKKGEKGKKSRKGRKGSRKSEDNGEGKTKKKGVSKKESGLLFKKRKGGKLPLDWPYKMGCKFLLSCIAYLSTDPDEDYNSRASEYFDVQAMALLEEICHFMSMSLPDPEKPTQYGETLVIMALNLSDWIAKYVTSPAQAIPDDKVDEYLALRGQKPKPPKPKKPPKQSKPPKKGKDKGGGGKKEEKGKQQAEPVAEFPEPVTEVQRNWNELKAPVYVPEKSRISRRKPLEEEDDEYEEKDGKDVGYGSDTDNADFEGIPRWATPTLDDIKKEFLEYINWYNPWEPEFMYLGPRFTPKGISMFKIWDVDSDEIPCDLRVLNWNQLEYGYVDNYSFIPSPVPQYYPALRPLRPIRLENVERSGIPKEVIKKNLRFFSPWYLMKKPLKPPPPSPSPEQTPYAEEIMGEFDEEELEDEMLVSEKPPPIKDSTWGDYTMREQLEILFHILHMMTSVPELTIEYVLEQLDEFCEAVELAEKDENPSEENRLLLKKRTIILEQYYLNFFGKKFRDFNDKSQTYMRVICTRLAYYIQLLYEYTARILWELQSRPNLPTPLPTPPETPDDPNSLQNWDDWLAWLMKVTKTCDEWAGWITETVTEAEKKAAKKKREFVGPDGKVKVLTADEWYNWKTNVERKVYEYRASKRQFYKESPYYLEKAKTILAVKHRHKVCNVYDEGEEGEGEEEESGEEEEKGEGEEEAGEDGEKFKTKETGNKMDSDDKVDQGETRDEEAAAKENKGMDEAEEEWMAGKAKEPETEDETEWEDVGEFD